MSLLDPTNEEEPTDTAATVHIIKCASCGTEYYSLLPPGQSLESLISDMKCPCGNSELSEKLVDNIPNETTET
jgi:hypothetical protein